MKSQSTKYLIACFLFFSSNPAFAGNHELCRLIKEVIAKPQVEVGDSVVLNGVTFDVADDISRGQILSKGLAEAVGNEILLYIAKKKPARFEGYGTVLASTAEAMATFHADTKVGWGESDTRLVLHLPTSDKVSVWSRLDPEGRAHLVFILERLFQSGKYDKPPTKAKDGGTSEIKKTIQDKLAEANGRPYHWLNGFPIEVGFDPVLFLVRAAAGFPSLVCRHSNYSFAGLLLMLGIPPADIRLVTAKFRPNAESHHIWIEVRFRSDGEWYEVDGTAAGAAVVEKMEDIQAYLDWMFLHREPDHYEHRAKVVGKAKVTTQFTVPVEILRKVP